jgi:hypothetical protein
MLGNWAGQRCLDSRTFLSESEDGIYSPHGIGRPDQTREYAGISASKTIWSSDGYWGGIGKPDAKGRRGAGENVAIALGERILICGGRGFELLLRGVYRDNNDRARTVIFEKGINVLIILANLFTEYFLSIEF